MVLKGANRVRDARIPDKQRLTMGRKMTGMILEGYDWELSEIMQSSTKLFEKWDTAVDVLKDSGYYVMTKDDGKKVIGKKTRERQQEESE